MTAYLWRLNVTSFRGISPGARHYYGTLLGPDLPYVDHQQVAIEWAIDAAEAQSQNDSDPDWAKHKAGDESGRFPTEAQLHAAAVEAFTALAAEGDLLIAAIAGSAGPAPVLAGPTALVAEATAMWERYDAVADNDDRAADAICTEWRRWEEATFEPAPAYPGGIRYAGGKTTCIGTGQEITKGAKLRWVAGSGVADDGW